MPDSPAIDAGDPSLTPLAEFDQRGTPFVRVFGARIDMGSFERQPVAVPEVDLVVDTLLDEMDADFAAGDLSLLDPVIEGSERHGYRRT